MLFSVEAMSTALLNRARKLTDFDRRCGRREKIALAVRVVFEHRNQREFLAVMQGLLNGSGDRLADNDNRPLFRVSGPVFGSESAVCGDSRFIAAVAVRGEPQRDVRASRDIKPVTGNRNNRR